MDEKSADNGEERGDDQVADGSDDSKISSSKTRMFAAFKNPVFRLYFGALLGQRSAMSMHMVARNLLLYRLTGSTALLGTMAIAHSLPTILTVLFGGALADRVHKKHMLLIGQAVTVLLFAGIAVSLTTGYLDADSWWILMATSAISGAFQGITMPSRQSIIPEIVGDKSIMNAVALNNVATNIMRFVAPVVAGLLIKAYDFHVAYYVMAFISAISMIFFALMPLTGRVVKSSTKMLNSIIEGLRYIWRNRTVFFVLVFMLVAIFLVMPLNQLLPVFTEDILNVDEVGLGVLMGVGGVGALIGSVILTSLPNKKRGLMLLAAYLISGVALVAFSFSTLFYLSIALMLLLGIIQAFRRTLSNSMVLHYTEDKFRGRVMSVFEMDLAITSLGTFGAGMIAELIGIQWSIGSFAIVLVIIAALSMIFVPRIRRLD